MGCACLTTSILAATTRPVTTSSAPARAWFNRGLVWAYAFNHEEAVACFERAIEADPAARSRYWGLAYALGPNYNKPWEAFDPDDLASSVSRAHAATASAAKHAARRRRSSARSRRRWPPGTRPTELDGDGSAWNAGYADAMREVYRAYPDDLDVAALFADALMNLTPWALWDQTTGEPAAGPATLEAKAVLERALARDGGRAHPGRPAHVHPPDGDVRPRPRTRCRPATCSATWSRTRATSGTCRPISTCCAATTAAWCRPTPPRSWPTRSSSPAGAR